jgi:hypothetical protein
MNLTSFVEQWPDTNEGLPLEAAGPSCQRLFRRIGDAERARSLIATSFWQSFAGSSYLLKVARELDLGDARALLAGEKIVVPRPDPNPRRPARFDLLILVQPQLTTRHMIVTPTVDEVLDGWNAWNIRTAVLSDFHNPSLAAEALQQGQPFGLVITTAPHTEVLSCVPSPSCNVVSGGMSSTAGAAAKDSSLRQGVTAALHAIDKSKGVTVNGQAGQILHDNLISDSCFIELPTLPAMGNRGQNGHLVGILPRGHESASFDGATSGQTSTTITGWSLELPAVQTYNQLKVYTAPATNHGDSGAALITDTIDTKTNKADDRIVGFAFERTVSVPGGPGAQVEFSTWIWADLVKQALRIEFL